MHLQPKHSAASPIPSPPAKTLTIIFQLPIPVAISMAAPISIARVDVSPMDPGIVPINISMNEGILVVSPAAQRARGVAPENPSTTCCPFVKSFDPYLVAGHPGRIAEKEKCTGYQGRIKNIHPCSAKYLFADNNSKCSCKRQHP